MNYYLIKNNKETILENLDEKCYLCFEQCSVTNHIKECQIDNIKKRQGQYNNNGKEIFLCSDEEIKSTKLFKNKLKLYFDNTKNIENIRKELINDIIKKNDRLLHNIITYNAHNIQELYSFVSQDELVGNIENQINILSDYITKEPEKTAKIFHKIVKNSILMKNELTLIKSIFADEKIQIVKRPLNIKKVLLNIFHIFFEDFKAKKVYVKINEFESKVNLNYEFFALMMVHIIDNMVKYIKEDTTLYVELFEENECIFIEFNMISLKIDEKEKDSIFLEGISGELSQKNKMSGKGIGMYIVKKVGNLIGCEVEFSINIDKKKRSVIGNLIYENNILRVKINK